MRPRNKTTLRARRQRLRSLADPLALAIIERLQTAPATSTELAEEIRVDPREVRGELRKLVRSEQIFREGTTKRRGRRENLYSAGLSANVMTAEDLVGIPEKQIEETQVRLLRRMFHDATRLTEAATFESDFEPALIRFPLPFEESGFREALGVHVQLFNDTLREIEEAKARIAASGEEPVLAMANFLFFKLPIDEWPGAGGEAPPARRSSAGRSLDWSLDLTDPLRSKLSDVLAVRRATATELADLLEAPFPRVRYELDRLLADGLVSVVSTRPARGIPERVFIGESRANLISKEETANSSDWAISEFSRLIRSKVFREALTGIRVGFLRGEEFCMLRVPMSVDSEGYSKIMTLIEASLDRLFSVRDRSLEKQPLNEPAACVAISDLLLYERGPDPESAK